MADTTAGPASAEAGPDRKPRPSATPPSHLLVTRAQPFEFATMLAWGARLVNPKVEDVDWPCYANSRCGNLHAGGRGRAPRRGAAGRGVRPEHQGRPLRAPDGGGRSPASPLRLGARAAGGAGGGDRPRLLHRPPDRDPRGEGPRPGGRGFP